MGGGVIELVLKKIPKNCGFAVIQEFKKFSTLLYVAPAFFYFLDFMRYCRKTETVKVISNQKEYLQEQAEISKCQF